MRQDRVQAEISGSLSYFQLTASNLSKNNLNDVNIYAEQFSREVLNLVFGYNLMSLNVLRNQDGIDLVDHDRKIVFQISITSTIEKVRHTVKQFENLIIKDNSWRDYNLKFYLFGLIPSKSIHDPKIPYHSDGIKFNPKCDILTASNLLGHIVYNCSLDLQERIRDYLVKYTGYQGIGSFNPSHLALIIELLASDSINESASWKINAFNLQDKVLYNNLSTLYERYLKNRTQEIAYLDGIYEAYSDYGKCPEEKIYRRVSRMWRTVKRELLLSNEEVFDEIIRRLSEELRLLEEAQSITTEDLQDGIELVVFQAFTRCKIFETPPGKDENYVYHE